jgi:hypothetical protein
MQRLQYRGLHLHETPRVQAVPQRTHGRGTHSYGVVGPRPQEQVHITLPDPRFVGKLLVGHRERPQCLGHHPPFVGQHGQLAALGRDDLAADENVVAEVHIGLPSGERLGAHVRQAQHRLQLCSGFSGAAFAQGCKAQLAGVPKKHHSPGHADDLSGRRVDRKVVVPGPNLAQGVGARDSHRVWIGSGREHARTLFLPDLNLLGNIRLGVRAGPAGGLAGRHAGKRYPRTAGAAAPPPGTVRPSRRPP